MGIILQNNQTKKILWAFCRAKKCVANIRVSAAPAAFRCVNNVTTALNDTPSSGTDGYNVFALGGGPENKVLLPGIRFPSKSSHSHRHSHSCALVFGDGQGLRGV